MRAHSPQYLSSSRATEPLLSDPDLEMAGLLSSHDSTTKVPSSHYRDSDSPADSNEPQTTSGVFSSPARDTAPFAPGPEDVDANSPAAPRVYKERFFGLAQLSLLNIMVSWSWLSYAPVSATAANYFTVSVPAINWLSTGFLFAFVAATPAVLYTLNRWGPRGAIRVASTLMFLGTWIRYAGARARGHGDGADGGVVGFGVTVFGQVLIGLAQPFVLAAPTRFSETWFTERGRISATAVASLANPFGGALGQLINPFWATIPSEIPSMVLYVAAITTAVTLATPFLSAAPPTPPTNSTHATPRHPRLTLSTLRTLLRNRTFLLLALPFATYVSAFNATSSLLVPILTPYSFSETLAGLAGAVLILAGLLSAACTSPFLDRRPGWRLPCIKVFAPVIAGMYVVLVWMPGTGSAAGVFVVMGLLGAASFSLVPVALELMAEVTRAEGVGAEASSVVAWAAGQAGGGVGIVVMDALGKGDVVKGEGVLGGMGRGLVWQAVWALVVLPAPLCLGFWGTGLKDGSDGDGLHERDEGESI